MSINLGTIKDQLSSPSDLSRFWQQYKSHVLGGLTGAGVGAAGLGALAHLSGEEDPEVKARNVKRNLLLGASLGGLGGLGTGSAYKMIHAEDPGNPVLNALSHSRTIHGAGLAAGLHSAWKKFQNTGKGFAWRTGDGKVRPTGGSWNGQTVSAMSDDLEKLVENYKNTLNTGHPPIGGGVNAPLDQGQKLIRDKMDQMLGGQTTTGSLSGKPIWRMLGLNTIDAKAENAVYNKLLSLTDSVEGRDALTRLTGPQVGLSGKLRGMPVMSAALSRSQRDGQVFLNRTRNLSRAGRLASGATLLSGGLAGWDALSAGYNNIFGD